MCSGYTHSPHLLPWKTAGRGIVALTIRRPDGEVVQMPYRHEMIYRTPPEYRYLLGKNYHEVIKIMQRSGTGHRFIWKTRI